MRFFLVRAMGAMAILQSLQITAVADTISSQLSGSSLVHGIPPECTNARYLIASRVANLLEASPAIDRDGDGVLTAEDTIRTIEQILASSFGDINQDCAVTDGDVDEFALDLLDGSEDVTRRDTSTDGFVDMEDLQIVVDPEVTQVRVSYRAMASNLYGVVSAIQWARNPASARNTSGPGTRNPQPHLQTISNYPSTHDWLTSTQYPNNHTLTVSQNWSSPPPPGPNHTTSVSSNRHTLSSSSSSWPPNHSYSMSESWNNDTHSTSRSELWYPHPNHAVSRSASWPGNHTVDVSDGYPPGHAHADSRERKPSDHVHAVSASWYPPGYPEGPHDAWYSNHTNHGKQNSDNWPPSHHDEVSKQWPPMHGLASSLLWPPGHVTYVSGGWPTDRRPLWPPNHVEARSAQDRMPTQPLIPNWPLLPEGHSYFTTVKDFFGQIIPPEPPCIPVD